MADIDEKEKAEKLAAAKKRFEQLKKQQKGKKGGTKKKEDKTDAAKEDGVADSAEGVEEPPEPALAQTDDAATVATELTEEPAASEAPEIDAQEADQDRPLPTRQLSLSTKSRERSMSFRTGSQTAPLPGDVNAESEVQDIYRKQNTRIEQLEKENTSLKEAQEEAATRQAKTEEELEHLREGDRDAGDLKSKAALADERASEIERLTSELVSTQRQLSQAQQSVASKNRRVSTAGASPDLTEQLASKTSTIESLELELSNLRNQLNIVQLAASSHENNIKSLEAKAVTAESAALSAQQELDTLKASISAPTTDASKSEDEDPVALANRITILQSDLRTAQSAADDAASRATGLEQKIEALTKLHKESTTTSTTREKEIDDLRLRIQRLSAAKSSKREDGAEELSDLEDEERETLHLRIRDLEAENFELRRGVWRDKRQALQPIMPGTDGGQTSPGYEDIDLNGTPYAASRQAMTPRGSSFQDVLQSGISAFTGRDRRGSNAQVTQYAHARKQSLGLLSEEDFDEDAFRAAQEDEAKVRLERVREVKRGLEQWRGWKVDIADLRASGLGGGALTGPVFDV